MQHRLNPHGNKPVDPQHQAYGEVYYGHAGNGEAIQIFRKTAEYRQRHDSPCRRTEKCVEIHTEAACGDSEYKIERVTGRQQPYV